jgi:hypothetical protein
MDEKLILIIKKLAYPEKYAPGYDHWHSGDGPAEDYYQSLSDEARAVLESKEG